MAKSYPIHMVTNLRKSVLFIIGCFVASSLFAQEEVLNGPEVREELELPLEQRLFQASRDSNMDFDTVLAEAIEAGMTEETLLVPQVINALMTRDVEGAKGLFPKLEAAEESLGFGANQPFASKGQFRGFLAISKAAVAFQEGDLPQFETYAVDGFLKAPELISAFGIDQMMMMVRQEEVQAELLANMKVPMDMVVASVDGESKELSEWLGDNKALLIDFWASWCGPCIRLMPQLKEKSEKLGEKGIVVMGMNTDDGEGQRDIAAKVQEERGMQSVTWLLDNNGGDLSALLMIDSIPRMVLVSPEGEVLYNGHPQDPALEAALAKL
ncbi:TlpA family protein disulfide reductase [Puniceicoccaceae bacterium K14]|nr:TlpA family protein disulfide reductase [Puniceicoccaceae bacterium K14]